MLIMTDHSSTHPELFALESGHFTLIDVEPPANLDSLEDNLRLGEGGSPFVDSLPRTIPREVHDRLREESFSKYAELWSNLANM